jgi:hypothetical protein
MAAAPQEWTLKEKTLEAHRRLQEFYGEIEHKARRDNLRELISTMLSHRTTHKDEKPPTGACSNASAPGRHPECTLGGTRGCHLLVAFS